MQAGEGGKLHVFLTSLPKNAGKHSLEARDQSHSQDDPQLSLQPGSKSFLALAASAAEYQASLCAFPGAAVPFVYLATLSTAAARFPQSYCAFILPFAAIACYWLCAKQAACQAKQHPVIDLIAR